jgi:hypothetical protein
MKEILFTLANKVMEYIDFVMVIGWLAHLQEICQMVNANIIGKMVTISKAIS